MATLCRPSRSPTLDFGPEVDRALKTGVPSASSEPYLRKNVTRLQAAMLQAIFYARFHPERGPELFSQWPTDVPLFRSHDGQSSSMLDFSELSTFLVPPSDLANRALSVCVNGYRILGFPVSIEGPQYPRNRFAINVCFVLGESLDQAWVKSWEAIVAKVARFMRDLESNGSDRGVLSREETIRDAGGEDTGVVAKVLRGVYEGLTKYGECCIRISKSQNLNLRLSTPSSDHMPTPKVRDWDVPLLIRALQSSEQETLDLVLAQIVPHVDGVSHVKKVAQLADVHLPLARKAIRALVRSGHAMILDIFHFQAVYQLTPDFAWFANDPEMIDECREYITIDPSNNIFAPTWNTDKGSRAAETRPLASSTIIELYSAIDGTQSVADFYTAHEAHLCNIDLRRLFTFGVIKGFLRRRHKFVVSPSAEHAEKRIDDTSKLELHADPEKAWRSAAFSSGWATPPVHNPTSPKRPVPSDKAREETFDVKLVKYLDGKHCLDQISVELGLTEKAVLTRLHSGAFGNVAVVLR